MQKCYQCPSCNWTSPVTSFEGIVICPECQLKNERVGFIIDCDPSVPIMPDVLPPLGTVGTELHSILTKPPYSWFISETEGCGCENIARGLNRRGNRWCELNQREIVDLLEMRAKKLEFPFSRRAARHVVRKAVKRAKKMERTENEKKTMSISRSGDSS